MKNILFVLLACLFCSLRTSYATASGSSLKVEEFRSEYGLVARGFVDPKSQLVNLILTFGNAGYAFDPPIKQGLSEVVATSINMGFFSTMNLKRFNNFLEDNNISFSVSSDSDNFNVVVTSWSHKLEEVFQLLKSVFDKTEMDINDLAQVKQVVLESINKKNEDPYHVALERLFKEVYGNHPYSRLALGSKESVKSITPQDVLSRAKEIFSRLKLNISVAGNFDRDSLIGYLDRYLIDLPMVSDLKIEVPDFPLSSSFGKERKGSIIDVQMHTPKKLFVFAYGAVGPRDPDYFNFVMLNYMLGGGRGGQSLKSLLTQEIRVKRAMTYGIGIIISHQEHSSMIIGSAFTSIDDIKLFKEAVYSVIQKFKRETVDEATFKNAKMALKDIYYLGLDSNMAIASNINYLQQLGFEKDSFDYYAKGVEDLIYEDFISFLKGPNSVQPDEVLYLAVQNSDPGN